MVTVGFTITSGAIHDLKIVSGTGTGDGTLDSLVLQQVATVKAPKIYGTHADEPHYFELELSVLTPVEWFRYNVYTAIDNWRLYPKEAILEGATGNTVVDFDYLDGNVTNITMTASSKYKELDRASIGTITKAIMPAALARDAGKSIHMEVLFCYSLIDSQTDIKNPCPAGENVIRVEGVRIRRVETTSY